MTKVRSYKEGKIADKAVRLYEKRKKAVAEHLKAKGLICPLRATDYQFRIDGLELQDQASLLILVARKIADTYQVRPKRKHSQSAGIIGYFTVRPVLDGTKLMLGWSVCSPHDAFSKDIGMLKALKPKCWIDPFTLAFKDFKKRSDAKFTRDPKANEVIHEYDGREYEDLGKLLEKFTPSMLPDWGDDMFQLTSLQENDSLNLRVFNVHPDVQFYDFCLRMTRYYKQLQPKDWMIADCDCDCEADESNEIEEKISEDVEKKADFTEPLKSMTDKDWLKIFLKENDWLQNAEGNGDTITYIKNEDQLKDLPNCKEMRLTWRPATDTEHEQFKAEVLIHPKNFMKAVRFSTNWYSSPFVAVEEITQKILSANGNPKDM